jgi:hypothetical protein
MTETTALLARHQLPALLLQMPLATALLTDHELVSATLLADLHPSAIGVLR